MIELFAHKQIRCKHCEFEFSFTEFSSAATIVCPACGEENGLLSQEVDSRLNHETQEHNTHDGQSVANYTLPSGSQQPILPSPVLCSVDHCPLLTGSESGNAIAEQLGLRLQQKHRRRRTILAWTVMLQVCVILGVALFAVKMFWTPKEEMPSSLVIVQNHSNKEGEPEEIQSPVLVASPPESITPMPVESEAKTAWNIVPGNEPSALAAAPEQIVSPFETVHDIFPPPMITPNTLAATSEHTAETSLVSPIPPTLPVPIESKPEEIITKDYANNLLESAKTSLATDPENSVRQAIQAAKIYEQLRQPLPNSMYWILGNAFASLSWGEPLLESSPAMETMTLSHENRYLLAQLKDKTVWLWDLQRPENERAGYLLDSGTAEYVKFVFSPDLRWIIGGQKNGTIRIWDMYRGNPGNTLITFTERLPDLLDLQISPNGQWLAAFGNSSGSVAFSNNRPTDQPIQQVAYQRPDHFGEVDLSPYPVLVWNLRQLETGVVPNAMPLPSIPQPVQVIQFSPNSDRLAVGRRDAVVWVYDLTAQGVSSEPFILRGHQLGITQIAFAPSGQWIATGSQDNTVRLWNLTSPKFTAESATLYGHCGWISALTIDSTGEYILSGSYDRTIRIWNVKRDRIGTALNEAPVVLETNLGIPESLAVTRDGDKMIVRGNEGSLGIYHFPSLFVDDFEDKYRAVTFRNSRLSISKCLLTSDDQLLIFSYEHLLNPSNSGIRLWALRPQAFVR